MIRASIAIGQSATVDVTVESIPFATALAAGRMAIYAGESIPDPGMSSGDILKRCEQAIGGISSQYRAGGGLKRFEFTDPTNEASGAVAASAAATSDATIGAIVNATGQIFGSTGLIYNGLHAAWKALREYVTVRESYVTPEEP